VTDVIGSKRVPAGFSDIRTYLESKYPGVTIIELPSGQDAGILDLEFTVPASLPCPLGTVESGKLTCLAP